jgi:hypothetical protein
LKKVTKFRIFIKKKNPQAALFYGEFSLFEKEDKIEK